LVRKHLKKNPLFPRGQPLLVSESPIEVGISEPSRPGFPELGVSVFSNKAFYTNTAGNNLQYLFIPYPMVKVNKITSNQDS
jgi:hypothetical protein